MIRIIIGLGIVGLGLLIYSLVECLQTPRHRIRVMPKVAWIAVIVLLPIIGASLWLGFGRVRAPKKGGQAPRRPRSPDDDPDFLRQVEIQRRQRQRAEEQRQRDAEARRKERELNARTQDARERELGDAADAAVAGSSSAEDAGEPSSQDGGPSNGRPKGGDAGESRKKSSDDDDDAGGPQPAPRS
ncbi:MULTISPECIES: PLD nuclease N-terminal domain-containing protein [unclassified Nesterenkonia]|uniref:PLD nuclease N-terminal domain-containing protein n=1 Tax=unclassified Nesterenkonia TaxID=2629769 RepID=UPI001F4CAFCE|nr:MULTISPECIES: PLDc N-terminal domain-containing protein [unclassified Nesterenkonia]MCH8560636.1 PLD nuclease N-terminal domain-containing protein [Nesterenkonia sp. DZ6]MCH8562914.1 PLD nuclease N-terminal domain-containing protein [Nesterenkonia sp. YGD6]